MADDERALVGLRHETPVPDTWHGLAPSPTLLGLGGGGQQMLSQPSCDGAQRTRHGMPIGKDQTGTADIQIALWDGLAARHGKPPESGATHVRAREQPKRCFIPYLAVYAGYFLLFATVQP